MCAPLGGLHRETVLPEMTITRLLEHPGSRQGEPPCVPGVFLEETQKSPLHSPVDHLGVRVGIRGVGPDGSGIVHSVIVFPVQELGDVIGNGIEPDTV